MSLIQVSRISRKLMRSLRLTEQPDAGGVLSPETVSVIIVDDLSAPLSDEERGCIGEGAVSAAAAEFPLIALVRVGAPAEYDLVLAKIEFTSQTDQRVALIVPTAATTGLTPGNTTFTDLAIPGRPSSQLGVNSAAAVPAGQRLWEMDILARVVIPILVKVRIGTIGDGNDFTTLALVGQTAQTVLRTSWQWAESSPLG